MDVTTDADADPLRDDQDRELILWARRCPVGISPVTDDERQLLMEGASGDGTGGQPGQPDDHCLAVITKRTNLARLLPLVLERWGGEASGKGIASAEAVLRRRAHEALLRREVSGHRRPVRTWLFLAIADFVAASGPTEDERVLTIACGGYRFLVDLGPDERLVPLANRLQQSLQRLGAASRAVFGFFTSRPSALQPIRMLRPAKDHPRYDTGVRLNGANLLQAEHGRRRLLVTVSIVHLDGTLHRTVRVGDHIRIIIDFPDEEEIGARAADAARDLAAFAMAAAPGDGAEGAADAACE